MTSAIINNSPAHHVDPGESRSVNKDEQALRRSAERFEALLVHTMLKGMRKTTLSESNSNERAVYDDMFDDRIATLVSQSGRLGISDAIVRQLRSQTGSTEPADSTTSPAQQLRAIMDSDRLRDETPIPDTVARRTPVDSLNALGAGGIRLREHRDIPAQSVSPDTDNTRQSRFLDPLMAPARNSARRLGTSPQAVLAIAALETGWGQHPIKDASGSLSNNLFGIKAQASDERTATAITTEYVDGTATTLRDRFKVYDNPAASISGFADFLLENPRYKTALQHAGDPERFLVELQRAGYATDPRYAQKAIDLMRRIETHTGATG